MLDEKNKAYVFFIAASARDDTLLIWLFLVGFIWLHLIDFPKI